MGEGGALRRPRGPLAAEERRELDDEVAERTRRERALVTLPARLPPRLGTPLRVALTGDLHVEGDLEDLGDDWLLVRRHGRARGARADSAAMVACAAGAAAEPGGVPALRPRLRPAGAVRDRATVV